MADTKIINESKVYDIDGVEIFKAGKWNGDNYTVDDIDEMVNSFNEIGGKIKPFIKLGHDEGQKLLQSDGMPAAGWVTNLRRVGDSLVAKLSNVPQKIYDLIVSKAYGRMSSEIYWNLKEGQKTYKRVLRAVALLGADTPAVTTLDDFINLYTDNIQVAESIKLCTQYEDKDMNKEELDIKKYEAQIDDLSTRLKVYQEENATLKTESESLKKFVEDQKIEAKKAEVVRYLDDKIREGKVVPAQVEMYTNIALSTLGMDAVKSLVENNPKVVNLTEESQAVEIEKKPEMDESEVIHGKAQEYAKANKVTYREALLVVANGGNE